MKLIYEKKGIKVIDWDEEVIFYNDDMLKNNIIIYEGTTMNDDDSIQTYISVKHYNDLDAIERQMYWGDLLAPIQVYHIVMDVFNWYKEYPLNVFFDIVNDISIGGTSSSKQSQQKNKDDVMNRIKEEIDALREGEE